MQIRWDYRLGSIWVVYYYQRDYVFYVAWNNITTLQVTSLQPAWLGISHGSLSSTGGKCWIWEHPKFQIKKYQSTTHFSCLLRQSGQEHFQVDMK